MSDRISVERLRQIEAELSTDILTDDDLVTALSDAGLPELARVVARFAHHGQPSPEQSRPRLQLVVVDDQPR
ncbi:MAG: hypothetical protein QOF58_3250 [Pseudonocardiales bacterium]|jgi:hypothetical protein|nr:hypothetical protein [Pseudonocardiales bacterium]